MKKIILAINILLFTGLISCKKFLDIVPDGIATIDNAFTTRYSAEKFLFTCYSYMPEQGSILSNPALTAGNDFFCATSDISTNGDLSAVGSLIQYGKQNSNSPYADAWVGFANLNAPGRSLYQGISDCNIFIENISKVPDMLSDEKMRWQAEAKFLKAYYHFLLVRQYGPIYLKKTNIPVGASIEETQVYRNTLDECFEYIEELLDEVIAEESGLPSFITNEAQEMGRITRGIAMAFKAYVQVTAASPLFNGNMDYAGIVDNRGIAIFNPEKSEDEKKEKWVKAAASAKAAIDFLEAQGHELYVFNELAVSEETKIKLSIRGAVTENFNKEVVWGNPNSWIGPSATIARYSWPRALVTGSTNSTVSGRMNVPLKFVKQFYTKNGVPIEEDVTYDKAGMFNMRTATAKEKYFLKQGYTTAGLNFDREPRFYADLIFDGAVWFGSGYLDEEDPLYGQMKVTQTAGSFYADFHNLTGYTAKKLNHYKSTTPSGASTATFINYAWPVIRLADIYLLYAEALNEAGGSKIDVLEYVDKVRARAGLNGVEWSWGLYSNNPNKPNTLEGRREIIRQERTIELAFEGLNYWDLRRWKTAYDELNKPIDGWYVYGRVNADYYSPVVLYQPLFSMKDYFWPIAVSELRKNPNLIQNLGY